jgi:hypothetical protein
MVREMGENRIEALLRDPTLESPSLDYFEVRMPWGGFTVPRWSAERIVEALTGIERPDWVRVETISGSVLYLKTETVVYVREWTKTQRETNRKFWKEIEEEDEEDEEKSEDGESDEKGGSSSRTAERPVPPSTDVRLIQLETNLRWLVAIVLAMIVMGLLG